jgi:hypothetical protein
MVPKDFVTLQRQEPFRPFRVTLTDGQTYDVIHPQLMMVGTDLMIGFPRKGYDQPIFERHVWLPYADIKQVDMLEPERMLKVSQPGSH